MLQGRQFLLLVPARRRLGRTPSTALPAEQPRSVEPISPSTASRPPASAEVAATEDVVYKAGNAKSLTVSSCTSCARAESEWPGPITCRHSCHLLSRDYFHLVQPLFYQTPCQSSVHRPWMASYWPTGAGFQRLTFHVSFHQNGHFKRDTRARPLHNAIFDNELEL